MSSTGRRHSAARRFPRLRGRPAAWVAVLLVALASTAHVLHGPLVVMAASQGECHAAKAHRHAGSSHHREDPNDGQSRGQCPLCFAPVFAAAPPPVLAPEAPAPVLVAPPPTFEPPAVPRRSNPAAPRAPPVSRAT